MVLTKLFDFRTNFKKNILYKYGIKLILLVGVETYLLKAEGHSQYAYTNNTIGKGNRLARCTHGRLLIFNL